MSTSEIIALLARLTNIEADIARIDAVLVMLAQLSRLAEPPLPSARPAPAPAPQAAPAVARQAAPRKRTPAKRKPAKVTIAEVGAA